MPRAILSVSDKTNLTSLARSLVDLGWDLIASGGTARALQAEGLPVTPVEVVTGAPEMLDGRVKTLHPAIHAGILARDTEADIADLMAQGYAPISMVVCNLYPFQEATARQDITLPEAIEQIDIGGVTLLRAAAKNFARVTAVCDPADYTQIIATLSAAGMIDEPLRHWLAVKAFAHTRDYDTAIHAFLQAQGHLPTPNQHALPEVISLSLVKAQELSHGQNAHQQAAFYAALPATVPLGSSLLCDKPLSYNNVADLERAWTIVDGLDSPTVAIVKHETPTGIATNSNLAQAFAPALASDRFSASGGVIAANRQIDDTFVMELGDLFIEALAAPEFTPSALAALQTSRPNCRLLEIQLSQGNSAPIQLRTVRGGFLAQTPDTGDPASAHWQVVTRWKLATDEEATLHFAWQCVQHVPSCAIILASSGATIGIGGGVPGRLDAARLALYKAGPRSHGAVLASDAPISLLEIIEMAGEAGITAIVQPGGSIRDASIIEAADNAGIAMVFTGVRHLRH